MRLVCNVVCVCVFAAFLSSFSFSTLRFLLLNVILMCLFYSSFPSCIPLLLPCVYVRVVCVVVISFQIILISFYICAIRSFLLFFCALSLSPFLFYYCRHNLCMSTGSTFKYTDRYRQTIKIHMTTSF